MPDWRARFAKGGPVTPTFGWSAYPLRCARCRWIVRASNLGRRCLSDRERFAQAISISQQKGVASGAD